MADRARRRTLLALSFKRKAAVVLTGLLAAMAYRVTLFVALTGEPRRTPAPSSSSIIRNAAGAGQAFEGKVAVTLGPYKNGAIVVTDAPSGSVEDLAVDTAFSKKKAKKTKFERINFTGSGARLGLTVLIEMEAKWAEGHPKKGQIIPGTKMKNYELELKEGQPEPWRQFVSAIVEKGMGQMEQKTFPVSFPEDYRKKDFAGQTVDFTVLVKEIGELKPLEPDLRPEEEQRAEIAAQLLDQAVKRQNEAIDKQLREELLRTSDVDTASKTQSVSWAKFGPESERAMKWNFIMEEVARVEGIPFSEVLPFLRKEAVVEHSS